MSTEDVPTPEEQARIGEEMMTPGQKKVSKSRERVYNEEGLYKDPEKLKEAVLTLEGEPGERILAGTIKGHKVVLKRNNFGVSGFIDDEKIKDEKLAEQLWQKYVGVAVMLREQAWEIYHMSGADATARDLLGE